MSLNEFMQNVPVVVPCTLIGLTFVGIATQAAIRLYRGEKQLDAQFKGLQDRYKDNFPKEELIDFYKELVRDVRPNLMGKKRKIADKMTESLEKQIMIYTTQETQESLANGTVLSFRDSIEHCSPTYKNAVEIFRN
jgi:hypothetical protein